MSNQDIKVLAVTGSLRIVAARGASADFSPDGRWFFTCAGARTCLWDAHALALKREIEAEARPGAFSPTGEHIVVYRPSSGQVQVEEVETGKVVNSFAAQSLLTGGEPIGASGMSVKVLRFSSTRPLLLIQAQPTYEYSEADDRYERMRQDATVYAVIREAFGDQVVSHAQETFQGVSPNVRYRVGAAWGTTQIVDTQASNVIYRTRDHVVEACFSQDEQYVLLVTGKHSLALQLPAGQVMNQVKAARWPNHYTGYSLPHTVWLLDRQNGVLVDGVTGQIVHRLDDLASPGFHRVSLSPKMRYAAGLGRRQPLRVRDWNTGEVFTHPTEYLGAHPSLVFSPDEGVLLVVLKADTRLIYV